MQAVIQKLAKDFNLNDSDAQFNVVSHYMVGGASVWWGGASVWWEEPLYGGRSLFMVGGA